MKMMTQSLVAAWLMLLYASPSAVAGEADVIEVQVEKRAAATYDFAVSVEHLDEGWNHYADKWDVVDDQGTVLATRVLAHPHVGEQPFTRGLSGVKLPEKMTTVTVRAHDSVHGYGGRTVIVDLP